MGADDLLCSRNARPQKGGSEQPAGLLARRAHTLRKAGTTPALVLCSRNAHDQNVLARRAQ